MKISIAKTSYDTSNPQSLKTLREDLKNIANIATVKSQIEHEHYVTDADIAIYQLIEPSAKKIRFQQRYVQQGTTTSSVYSFLNGHFYLLPQRENLADIPYVLITKYLYESNRHGETQEPSASLRSMINKFIPNVANKNELALKKILMEREETAQTYFGDELSDNSDSDDETQFKTKSVAERLSINANATVLANRASKQRYESAISRKNGTAPSPDIAKQASIPRDTAFNNNTRRQAIADLEIINQKLKENYQLTPAFLHGLNTKFVVAQYRGIHYFNSNWGAQERRTHRKIDEQGQAQFSSAALASAGVQSYEHYVQILASPQKDELFKILEAHASSLENKLLAMQHSGPIEYNGQIYLSLFHLIQFWYSSDYDGFPQLIKKDLDKAENSLLKDYLSSPYRPLLSTGDIGRHALFYAYGAKIYKGHEHQRLDPAWHSDGTVERPYSGKVYVSLHPLNDYTERKPTHITSQFIHGLIQLSNIISAERETSFLGYMPKDRVVLQHLAKYPSFKGVYKEIYQHKYGLYPALYAKMQEMLKKNPPHSAERKRVILILEEYFCAYQEMRLITEAARIASERGEVLIYRDEDGGFSLEPPDTPSTRVSRLHDFIMNKREQYANAPVHKKITPLSQERRAQLVPQKIEFPIDADRKNLLEPKL